MERPIQNSLTDEEKQELFNEKNRKILEKYAITSMEQIQGCNLAEFLISQHPEKYDKTPGTRMDYENNENLQKIYAVIDKQENRAIMINTNEKGKVPQGEFGVYDFVKNQFEISGKVKDEIVKYLGIGALTRERQDEIIKTIFHGTLSDMDKLATMDIGKVIDSKITEDVREEIISKQIDEQNAENGMSKEDREKYEKGKNKKDDLTVGEGNSKEENEDISKDVKDGMKKAGATQIVRYFYVNAKELGEKVDDAKVNKTGDKVLIMEIADSSRAAGPNRYYAFQDNRMVLWGNDDKDVKEVVGNNQKMGQVLQPLRLQQPEYIEYRDSNGLYIREEIDDKMDLSVEEIKRYKLFMEDTLEQYSSRINVVLCSDMPPEEKIKKIQDIDDWCDRETTGIAEQNDVSRADDERIDLETDEQTAYIQGQIAKDKNDDYQKQLGPNDPYGRYE